MKTIVILISGRGTNMEALLRAGLPCRVAAVISNRPSAPGLEIARARGASISVVDHRCFPSREAFDEALRAEIDRHSPDLVVLAGFMRILGDRFVSAFDGRMVNIHPSLLPAFPGVDTHRRALQAGVRIHGCTVHFVTPNLDNGPVVIQAAVPVLEDDDEELLAARVLAQEHVIYPQAVRWFLEGRVKLGPDGRVRVAASVEAGAALRVPPTAG